VRARSRGPGSVAAAVEGDGFTTVARADELPPGRVLKVRAGEDDVALAHCDDGIHAVQNACIHLQGPLGEGWLDGCVLTCPWHGWQYDVRTGKNEFDHAIQLRTYETRVVDGEIQIRV
jgi:nitrite reductase/ring-hydroxylating ferredoxin subunit